MKDLQSARGVASGILVSALAVLIIGCETTTGVAGSASIIDLDKELVELYREKLDATDAQPAANSRLADLAARAGRQGDASAGNPPSAVRFYRIAATPAWAAGPPHNTQGPDLSEKGSAACGRLPNGDASQPRDCAVLKMAPNLALLDATALDVRKLRDAGQTIPPASFDHAVRLSEDVSLQVRKILEARSAAGAQAESFEQYLQSNLNAEFCMLQGLVGRFAASSPPEPLMERMRTAARDAQGSLRAAGVPTACN